MLVLYEVFWIGTMLALFVGLVIGVIRKIRRAEARANDLENPARQARWALAGLIVAVAAGSLAYKQLVYHHLEQTAALFIGLPALLAVVVILATRPKSATGMACKATAVALLVSGIFLGEGFICILMAAPLFFGVAVLIGGMADSLRDKKRSHTTMWCLLALVFLPISMEGVRPGFSFPREETITVERVVSRSAGEVETNLAQTPVFAGTLPTYLRLGFPRPVSATGSGMKQGDTRVVHFAGGEGKPGDLAIEVVEAWPGHAVFAMKSDTSHVAHWLRWKNAEVNWQEQSPHQTRVHWVLHYRRSLDPAWYFKPWERYAVKLAGGYLIENVAGR